ncbi:MAG: helix-turn-helix transcriptional regulator [Bacteroidota bacterium]
MMGQILYSPAVTLPIPLNYIGDMTIGEKIRRIRREKDLSQEYVAEQVGVNVTYISKIERGKSDPDTELLTRIAKALGVQIVDFFAEEKQPMVQESHQPYQPGVFFSMPGNISEEQREQIKQIVEALAKLDSGDKEAILKIIQGMSKKKD